MNQRTPVWLGTICFAAMTLLLLGGCQQKTVDNVDTSVPSANSNGANSDGANSDTLEEDAAADTDAALTSEASSAATRESASGDTSTADHTDSVGNANEKATTTTTTTGTPQTADAEPATETNASADTESSTNTDPSANTERIVTGDWPMWGGNMHRNMVNGTTGISLEFDPRKGKNVLWKARIGTHANGNAVVSGGKVLIGTNNDAEHRPQHQGDRGCVLCFDEKSGEFLWQLTREKLPSGEANDWPDEGICSSPCIEGDRVWVVTNRCELMCLDLEGMHDGENDGPYKEEVDADQQDADIVWSLDMMAALKVFPRNLATSSPVVYGDNVYAVTGNGVEESGRTVVAPDAPSFVCVNKKTGEVVWKDNSPGKNILDGQWGSPAAAEVNGKAQVYFPGGDGWLYAFDALSGDLVWKFDLNPKDSKFNPSGRSTRNQIISTPVFIDNSVILACGMDPGSGAGVGHLYRIDATKTGDVSAELDANQDHVGEPNPNSAVIWHYGGVDKDGSITGEANSDIFKRSISTVAVHNDLVYASDIAGFLHCVDFESGKRYWVADVLASVWGSPMVADGKIFLGDEDGDLAIFAEGKTEPDPMETIEKTFSGSLLCTVTIANGVMYIAEPSTLYAISIGDK